MPPRALAPLAAWLLAAWLAGGCAPAPRPPAPRPPARRPTFALALRYRPRLALRVLRDGVPFSGPLTAPAHRDEVVDEFPSAFVLRGPRLSGQVVDGFYEFPDDAVAALAGLPELVLRLGDDDVPLPHSGGSSPLQCSLLIAEVARMDACLQPLPSPSEPPERCDAQGQEAWIAAIEARREQADACWTSLDAATMKRLAAAPSNALPLACERLRGPLEAGDEPADPATLRALCWRAWPTAPLQRLENLVLERSLPEAFERASAGTSREMHDFVALYRSIAPDRAEQMRALAERRFGPKDPARWFALRASIEAFEPRGPWRATLCDADEGSIEVAVQQGDPPRYAAGASPAPSAAIQLVFHGSTAAMYARAAREREAFLRRLVASLKARKGVKEVTTSISCLRGLHWYLADREGPTPRPAPAQPKR